MSASKPTWRFEICFGLIVSSGIYPSTKRPQSGPRTVGGMRAFESIFIIYSNMEHGRTGNINIKQCVPILKESKMFVVRLLLLFATICVVHVSGQCTANGESGRCTTNPGDCKGYFFNPSTSCSPGTVSYASFDV